MRLRRDQFTCALQNPKRLSGEIQTLHDKKTCQFERVSTIRRRADAPGRKPNWYATFEMKSWASRLTKSIGIPRCSPIKRGSLGNVRNRCCDLDLYHPHTKIMKFAHFLLYTLAVFLPRPPLWTVLPCFSFPPHYWYPKLIDSLLRCFCTSEKSAPIRVEGSNSDLEKVDYTVSWAEQWGGCDFAISYIHAEDFQTNYVDIWLLSDRNQPSKRSM